jgi:hypothetical protein
MHTRSSFHLQPVVCTLFGALLLSLLGVQNAQAQISGCRSDPKVSLSNGGLVTLTATSSLSISQVSSITYELHIPAGQTVTNVAYTGGAYAGKEKLTWFADDAAGTYNSMTTLSASSGSASVTANITVNLGQKKQASAQVTGSSGQPLSLQVTP